MDAPTRKIIFLDFDGPLSNARTSAAGNQNAFDPLAIRTLNKICQTSGAKIVPISTRIHNGSVIELRDAFDKFIEAGGNLAYLHEDWCFYEDSGQKDKGVNHWLETHELLTHYVVVEDEDLGLKNQVIVCETDGLLTADYEKISEGLGIKLYQAMGTHTTLPHPILNQMNLG